MGWSLRRHVAVFGVAAFLAVLATMGFALLRAPMWSSSAAVVVPVGKPQIWTQARIANSLPVLIPASESSAQSFPELVRHVKITVMSSDVLAVTVTGWTAGGAQRAAEAVAWFYLDYVRSPRSPGGPVQAAVMDPATPATRTSASAWVAETAGFGTLLGLALGVIAAFTLRWAPRYGPLLARRKAVGVHPRGTQAR